MFDPQPQVVVLDPISFNLVIFVIFGWSGFAAGRKSENLKKSLLLAAVFLGLFAVSTGQFLGIYTNNYCGRRSPDPSRCVRHRDYYPTNTEYLHAMGYYFALFYVPYAIGAVLGNSRK